jgi:integrase
MAKKVRERTMDSSAARAKLKASGKPYWRGLGKGVHLGYRKGLTGGKWVVRRYLGNEKYSVETIAEADDHLPADGGHILDFHQAQDKAREVAAQGRAPASPQGPLTVAAAMDAYFKRLKLEDSKSLKDAIGRAGIHILPALGDKPVAELTRDMLTKWLGDTAGNIKGGQDGADGNRARRATANRVLTILRAALNQAFREGKVATDVPWRTVKPFSEVDAPRLRYFTKDEVRRLINAAQGSFRDLVKAALFTGCRYGELTRLRVGDFNPDSGTVFVGQSKSGKARHVVLAAEGQRFFETLTAGRHGDDLMLTRASGEPWGPSNATLLMSQACKVASIAGGRFHILRHTAASHLVMSGVPSNVVAHSLGHADTRMTERHYAHLSRGYVAETIRKFAPTFDVSDETNVVLIGRK